MEVPEQGLSDKILDAIAGKRWSQLDELWINVIDAPPPPLHFHEPIVTRLIRKHQTERLSAMYVTFVEQRLSNGDAEHSLRLMELMLSVEPALEFLRDPLVRALKALHSDRDPARLQEFFEVSGLAGETPDLRKCLAKFDELLGATKGQVFRHRTWGLGIVRSLDTSGEGKVVIDFELRKSQSLTLKGVSDFLERIPRDHMLAKMATAPEELKQQAKDDPAAVLKLALKGNRGRMKAAELKRLLTTRFMSEAEYRSFWNGARDAIKVDPWLEMEGQGTHAELVLRTEPRSFIDSILKKMKDPADLKAVRGALRDVRIYGEDAELSEDDQGKLYAAFSECLKSPKTASDGMKLNYALLFEEFAEAFGEGRDNPVALAPFFDAHSVHDMMPQIVLDELYRVAMEQFMKLHPENWQDDFVEAMPFVDSKTAAWAERELRKAGHEESRQHALENVLSRPDRNPELFLWGVRNMFEGNWPFAAAGAPLVLLVEETLSLLDSAHELSLNASGEAQERAKSIVSRIRSLLQEGQSKHMRRVIAAATPEEARRLLTRIHLHEALAAGFKENTERLIFTEHPSIKKVSKHEEEEERKKPAFHYALAESVDRKRMELSHILNVEIPANSVAIGAARELGDLRENAEYHAAKDRQKLLHQTAAELEELISRARIVEPESVNASVSRFGTKIKIRNTADNSTQEHTLLGMWEADQAKGFLSYLTPLGSQLMNRRPGEVFTVVTPDGRREEYEAISVEKAI